MAPEGLVCMQNKSAGEEGISSVGEIDRKEQNKEANKQSCLKICSSTFCFLAGKHSGIPFSIPGSIFSGVTRRVSGSNSSCLKQAPPQ